MLLTDMDPDYGRAYSLRADGAECCADWWAPFPPGSPGPVATIQVYGPDSTHLALPDLPEWTPARERAYYPLADLQARAAVHGFTTWADAEDWSEYAAQEAGG